MSPPTADNPTVPTGPQPGPVLPGPTAPDNPGGAAGPTVTRRTTAPALHLSTLVGLKSAVAHFATGDQELERGAGLPWGVDVTLTPTRQAPLVLVLSDGGLVTIEGGPASVRMEEPDERPAKHGDAETGPDNRRRGPRAGAMRVRPVGARAVYVSVPYGIARPRRMQIGALMLETHGGTEVLATFNAEQQPLAILELSGERPLFIHDPAGNRHECPADHVLDLRQPDRPKSGAAVAIGQRLRQYRLLHSKEALRGLLDVAKDSPVAARLSDTLSHLHRETLRRCAPSIARLLAVLSASQSPREDVLCIARVLRSADRRGLEVRLVVDKAIWAKSQGETGPGLAAHLDKFLAALDRDGVRFGAREHRKK